MDCELVRSLMSSYIDRDINEIDKNELEEHLKTCKECATEYRLLLSTVQYCNNMEEIELPENFHQDIMVKLQELGSDKTKKRFFNRNWSKIAGIAAVFIVVIIGVSSLLGLPGFNISDKTAKDDVRGYGAAPQFTAQSPDAAPAEGNKAEVNFSEAINADSAADVENYSLKSTAFSLDKQKEAKEESFERKIITSGSVSLEVMDFDNKMKGIEDLAKRNGGYVESSNVDNNAYYGAEGKSDKLKTGSITLRIPAAKFSSTVEEVKTMGKVTNHNTNSVDITEQYYDTATRVENLKVQENRLRELVGMAKNVDEILKIENELNRVRSDIELMSTDIKRWDKQVSMSSLYIGLREVNDSQLEGVDITTTWGKAYKGFIKAVNNVVRGTESLFIFIVTALPYIAILAIVLAIVYYAVRRIRSRGVK